MFIDRKRTAAVPICVCAAAAAVFDTRTHRGQCGVGDVTGSWFLPKRVWPCITYGTIYNIYVEEDENHITVDHSEEV